MPKSAEQKQIEDNLEVSEQDKSDEVKCDNHPRRKARTFTANGAIAPVHWCDECTPPWYKDEEEAAAL